MASEITAAHVGPRGRKLSIGGCAGMAVAALIAAPVLLVMTGRARIVVVMISLKVFPTWQSGIGLGAIMVCFAAISVLAIGFVYRFLPETKNRSAEEITELFEHNATSDRRAGMRLAKSPDAAAA